MLHQLKRHPFEVRAHFRDVLVLTYALPADVLRPMLPPGLTVDVLGASGFVAIAMVWTERLRPAGFPVWMGRDFFLAGYRVFARRRTNGGRTLRGLRILRSETDSPLMRTAGNLLTHYNYHMAEVRTVRSDDALEVGVRSADGHADLDVRADLSAGPVALPAGSPFEDVRAARRFAGPLPFTFDYEAETDSIIMIEGVRANWSPRPVTVEVRRNTFFDGPEFSGARATLAGAFHLSGVPYRWMPGVRERLAGGVS